MMMMKRDVVLLLSLSLLLSSSVASLALAEGVVSVPCGDSVSGGDSVYVYVDSERGNDSWTGASSGRAMRTLHTALERTFNSSQWMAANADKDVSLCLFAGRYIWPLRDMARSHELGYVLLLLTQQQAPWSGVKSLSLVGPSEGALAELWFLSVIEVFSHFRSLAMRNLWLRFGAAQRMNVEHTHVTVERCFVQYSRVLVDMGAVDGYSEVLSLTIKDSNFTGDIFTAAAPPSDLVAGLWVRAGRVNAQITNSEFRNFHDPPMPAAWIMSGAEQAAKVLPDRAVSTITLDHVRVHDNNCTTGSACFSVSGSLANNGTRGTVSVHHSQFYRNRGDGPGSVPGAVGAALRVGVDGDYLFRTTVQDCQFWDNSVATGEGAAIASSAFSTLIYSTTFTNNRAWKGGAVSLHSSQITLSDSTFTNNAVSEYGPAGTAHVFGHGPAVSVDTGDLVKSIDFSCLTCTFSCNQYVAVTDGVRATYHAHPIYVVPDNPFLAHLRTTFQDTTVADTKTCGLSCTPGTANRLNGTRQEREQLLDCQACAKGEEVHVQPPNADNNELAVCVMCAPGSFVPQDKYSRGHECQTCAAGRYSAKYGAHECDVCLSGSFSKAGATSCHSCEPGTFSSVRGKSSCSLCATGKFTSAEGGTGCVSCPPLRSTGGLGGTKCDVLSTGAVVIICISVALVVGCIVRCVRRCNKSASASSPSRSSGNYERVTDDDHVPQYLRLDG
eukprot:TRINITY_DN56130_c0_g1_i1.p1 TRINITY_DN56130_c0_g1~~TRINITY_DN56130_c0_g1_i1.p1  ORF type:complete len:724 (-),score=300.65 TRINITY_DN56130_c0_g1_i1:9-2180(-)